MEGFLSDCDERRLAEYFAHAAHLDNELRNLSEGLKDSGID